MSSRIAGNVTFTDDVIVQGTFVMPDGTVTNAKIPAAAGLTYDKLEHEFSITYGQSGNATAATVPIHLASAAGEVLSVSAGSIGVATSNGQATVDVKKNGTTILTGVITLDTGNTARVAEAGTLVASPTLADGDLLEVVITASGSALPTGLFVNVVLKESAIV